MMKEVKLFLFTKNNDNKTYYSGDIPELYNVSSDIYIDLLIEVQEKFRKLRAILKKKIKNHGHHVNLILPIKEN